MGTVEDTAARTRIRNLNDQFRRDGLGTGTVLITPGIREKGHVFVGAVLIAVRSFTAFTKDNDPYDEHDFGSLTIEGERLFWKLDYYNLSLDAHSPNAADPAQTHRVLTIMLASEY